jgi:hypothetical protein
MATVYIAPTSQGLGDGTSAANAYPFSSLSSAEIDAGTGGEIIFLDGTYSLSTVQTFTGSGGTHYKAQNEGSAIIDANNYRITLGNNASADWTFTGLEFIDLGEVYVHVNNAFMGYLTRCKFTSNSGYSNSNGNFIQYVDQSTYGIRLTCTNCVFKFENATASGEAFHQRKSAPTWPYLKLDGCTLVIDQAGGIVAHNIDTAVYKNTIISNINATALTGLGTNTSLTESYNCYHNIGKSADPANGIIVDDPQFVDVPNGDLRLRPSSPCINAGTAS